MEIGFDPLKIGGKGTRLELVEIMNGRLAMIAIGGMIHGSFITGTGVLGMAN